MGDSHRVGAPRTWYGQPTSGVLHGCSQYGYVSTAFLISSNNVTIKWLKKSVTVVGSLQSCDDIGSLICLLNIL